MRKQGTLGDVAVPQLITQDSDLFKMTSIQLKKLVQKRIFEVQQKKGVI